jgi:hypothetical protein
VRGTRARGVVGECGGEERGAEAGEGLGCRWDEGFTEVSDFGGSTETTDLTLDMIQTNNRS